MRRELATAAMAAILIGGLTGPSSAAAFCGFYVSGAGADLYNQATVVVLMRDGTRTVLSMRNAYEGPPEDFAMVVPVPVVLSEDDVKTLPTEVFERVDRLAAPRLVEYWEQDPCRPMVERRMMMMRGAGAVPESSAAVDDEDLGVTIEAQFEVGEYDIVILGARDSSGLDTWLRREGYSIPTGAEPVLRPYVAQGTKFFVAKVNVERVTFRNGRALLSPLRVQYESETFSLPIRLGLINSRGVQDLLVHVLARGQRYETANYDNVTVPTNLLVNDNVRQDFGSFYNAVFDRLLEEHPRSVVTEYSWNANGCDPCPTPALNPGELATLGLDVVGGDPYGFVLTRLHFRYTAEQASEDLVFRPAPPIVGGRGIPDQEGQLQREPQSASQNAFQGRYAILHPWEGPVACPSPVRGNWGGPPGGVDRPTPRPATNLAFAGRGQPLGTFLAQDVPELQVRASQGEPLAQPEGDGEGGEGTGGEGAGGEGETGAPPPTVRDGGCASCAIGGASPGRGGRALLLAGLAALALALRRRRR
ncbi:MAG: DUF2330 domain-containing protein [Sandaracinaceae bacterium]